jgi:hypothetical protein
MTDADATPGPVWSYRFIQPDETEIATKDLGSDGAAEAAARDLSKSTNTPVIVHRLQRAAGSWEYVIEVDERSDI